MITFGSPSVWPSLANVAITLAVIAVVVSLVVWRGRRRGSRTIALDAALAISGWWILLAAAGAIITIVKVFAVDWAELSGRTLVWLDWPSAIPCSESGEPSSTMLNCGSSELTVFTVSNASLGLRALAAAANLSTHALVVMPAVVLAVICFSTLRGRTFSRTVTKALSFGAIAVLVLGLSSDLLGSVAATAGLREAVAPDSEWYPTIVQLTVTPIPFIGALALAALAAVFHQGMRMQREKEQLQRETEGLV